MQIGILARADGWYFRDLERAAAGRCQLETLRFDQLAAVVGGAAGGRVSAEDGDLGQLDVLLVRSMPPGSLEQIIFRMDALGQLAAGGLPIVNSPRAMETAIDKYLTTARLAAAGLETPETVVCQNREEALAAFHQLGGDVVVKPLFGGEGRGVARLADAALAERTFQLLAQLGAVVYLQRFVEHEGGDLRLMIVGQQVLGMRRHNPLDWRSNASRGASCEPLAVADDLEKIARRAAAAVGAEIAAVDLLPGLDGRLYAIEVNASPGWRALSRTLGVDVAALVLDHLLSRVKERAG